MAIQKKNYRIVQHFLPGSNTVQLVLLRGLHGKLVIWRPESGQRGSGDVLHEMYAYEISNVLGLDVVAKAWPGRLGDERGVFQDFIDGVDGYTWDDMARHHISQTEDYANILILDYLTGNHDRYRWHMIHVPRDGVGRLWSTDHTNIFQYDPNDIHRVRVGLSCAAGIMALQKMVEHVKKPRVVDNIGKLQQRLSKNVSMLVASEFLHRLDMLKGMWV